MRQPFVSAKIEQDFDEAEKKTARDNIDVPSKEEVEHFFNTAEEKKIDTLDWVLESDYSNTQMKRFIELPQSEGRYPSLVIGNGRVSSTDSFSFVATDEVDTIGNTARIVDSTLCYNVKHLSQDQAHKSVTFRFDSRGVDDEGVENGMKYIALKGRSASTVTLQSMQLTCFYIEVNSQNSEPEPLYN